LPADGENRSSIEVTIVAPKFIENKTSFDGVIPSNREAVVVRGFIDEAPSLLSRARFWCRRMDYPVARV